MMRKKIFAAVGMLLLVIGLCGVKSYMRQMKIRENEEAQKIEKQKEAAQERKEAMEQRKKQEEEKKQKAKEQQKIIKRQKKIQICIDPGHYSKKNEVYENGKVVYCEGNFTLQVAKELKKILEERYGVIVHLTRTSGNICINGYENLALDSGKSACAVRRQKAWISLFHSIRMLIWNMPTVWIRTDSQLALQSQL